jgi:uncharacterized membrane protein YeaQ/YmgE (transglycosylase-associated protein family)
MGNAWEAAFGGTNIIWLILVGIVLGFLAKLLIPGDQNIPWWLTIIAGILGAGLGNIVSALLDVKETSGIDWIQHLLQVAGAVVVVIIVAAIWAKVKGGRRAAA